MRERNQFMCSVMLFAIGALFTLGALTAAAAVPGLINFQGILRDVAGDPVANGSYPVVFTIYDAPAGGTNLWSETQSVNTTNGLFTVLLGSGPIPLADTTFNDSTRWLGVKVGADPEMTPRQRLSSVGFSYNSSEWTSTAGNLFRLNGDISIGTAFPLSGTRLFVVQPNSFGNGVYGFGGAFAVRGDGGTYGVYGSGGSYGVSGSGSSYGGYFTTFSGGATGVYARGTLHGVYGDGKYGVVGTSTEGGGAGVYGSNGGFPSAWAGYYVGDVRVDEDLVVVGVVVKGGGGFKIDHPTDPANKYLYHSFVESPDMTNFYNGNVTLDARGEATVQLPDWFGAVNKDFRYQLTAIGAPGPNLYIAEEISGNQFKIAGGTAGVKVSWQVTGIRQDAFANAHRIPVEEDKLAAERGKYIHPEELGFSKTLGMNYEMTQKMEAEHKQQEDQRARMEQERLIQEQKIRENK